MIGGRFRLAAAWVAAWSCIAAGVDAQAQLADPAPRLAGVVTGNGERHAILATTDGSFSSLMEGERLGDFTVVTITSDAVCLHSAAGTQIVRLGSDATLREGLTAFRPPAPLSEAERQADEDNNR